MKLKEYPDHRIFETEMGGRKVSFEVGKMAELANGSCLVRYGDTVVLIAAVASAVPKPLDYFPLTIDFEERIYSVGRIPGAYLRREGRPSEKGILAARLIDRPIRPFFDDDLRNDVVITCTVMSNDYDNSVEMAALIGTSFALSISDIPWNGPLAGAIVGYVDGEYVINPTSEQRQRSDMFVTIASTDEKVVMIETEANQISEDILFDGICYAHEECKKLVNFIKGVTAEIGKPKFSYDKAPFDEALYNEIVAFGMGKMESAMDTDDKNVREERINTLRAELTEKFSEQYPEMGAYLEECLYKLQKKVVKKWLLTGKRVDGRGMDEIRPLSAEVGLLPRVHGSGMFTRGQTQVLTTATLATISMAQKLDTIFEEESKRYIHHYNFPSFSTGEARSSRSTSRREYGHGALAEKALVPVLPPIEKFPYVIRLVSEVLSSNGSTSQASICGSTLALMDAGVPISAPVAGISCGLISEGDKWTIFTDIQGVEDFHGEMDFKVAGTKKGITAIQMDLKNDGLTPEIIKASLELTRKARFDILDGVMLPCISTPREELSQYAPKMLSIKIAVEKIREVIGSGGKTIQKITADTGAKIDIDDEGNVFISSIDSEACRAAKAAIENIVFVPEIGKLYHGKVVRIIPIGAFVELVPGKEGMIHISKLENRRVEKVEDVVNVGDMTWVKVTEIDEKGRINLSRKDALKEMA